MHVDAPTCTATKGGHNCVLEANHAGSQENTGHRFRIRQPAKEAVNNPAHYNAGKFEVIDVIQDWKLGFCEGNVVKYVARAKHKGNELEELRKSAWYLDYRIRELEQLA